MLPDLGEGLTESEILSWKVAEGDQVVLNQVIAEVETAKAVVELPSPYSGVVSKLHELPGTVVEVGKPIVSFDVADGVAGEQAAEPVASAAPGAEAAPQRVPTLVGYGAEPDQEGRPARRRKAGAAGPAAAEAPTSEAAPRQPAERPRSTPPVRKLARDAGVDLAMVHGTGPGGLITRDDVQQVARIADSVPASLQSVRAGRDAREERVPIKGVRKHTAAAMVTSAFTAPHVTEFLTVDITATMELLAGLRRRREFADLKLTPLTILAKALCLALRRNPSLNSRWDEQAQEIVTMSYIHLGIAAATPRGLLVPNIKEAQSMSLAELAQALSELAQTARAGKTAPEQLSGGTISITNIGVFGIDAGTPILNLGEAAIVAMGAVRKQPWEYQGQVALRDVVTLSLSFDHRLVDGEQGSRFLGDIGAILADPAYTLAVV